MGKKPAETPQRDWEKVTVKGLAGEEKNAQMQHCYVLYHGNGATLAISY